METADRQLFTIGHSTRPLSELVGLLNEHGVRQLVDVRHFPRSRRNPQFNLETLSTALPERGIAYHWEGETLGGFRAGGYRDYMQSDSFQLGLRRLESLVAMAPTAIMCAEIVWFRCHRRFIARQMVSRGYPVTHIVNAGKEGSEERLPHDTDGA